MAYQLKVPVTLTINNNTVNGINVNIDGEYLTASVWVQIVDSGAPTVVLRQRSFSNTVHRDTGSLYDSVMGKLTSQIKKWFDAVKLAINIENNQSANVRADIESIT